MAGCRGRFAAGMRDYRSSEGAQIASVFPLINTDGKCAIIGFGWSSTLDPLKLSPPFGQIHAHKRWQGKRPPLPKPSCKHQACLGQNAYSRPRDALCCSAEVKTELPERVNANPAPDGERSLI